MANKKISQLTEFTGSTSGVYMIMNTSDQTATYKVTKEVLVSNLAVTSSNSFVGTQTITGSLNITNVLNLAQLDPLPSGSIGDLAVSGSSIYFYNGSQWLSLISTPTPSPSVTPSTTPSVSVTPSTTPSSEAVSATPSATPSVSVTPSISTTPSAGSEPSVTPSISTTPSAGGVSVTPTVTPSSTPSSSTGGEPSVTPSISTTPSAGGVSVTPTVTPSATPSSSTGGEPSVTPSVSTTPSAGGVSVTPTVTPSSTPSSSTGGEPSVTPSISTTPSAGGVSVTPSITPTRTPSPTSTPTPYTIGQAALGGTIAYILQSGDPGYDAGVQHGLVATATDTAANAVWGCPTTAITGADGIVIGTGNQNTIDIMAGCATAGIAARLCGDLSEGGYSDWYLPSKNELNKLYLNKTAIGGFADYVYWSSTESDTFGAWGQDFTDGTSNFYSKSSNPRVRAIRSF